MIAEHTVKRKKKTKHQIVLKGEDMMHTYLNFYVPFDCFQDSKRRHISRRELVLVDRELLMNARCLQRLLRTMRGILARGHMGNEVDRAVSDYHGHTNL